MDCNKSAQAVESFTILLYNIHMKLTLIIAEKDDGISLKEFLSRQGYSTTQIKRFKYSGEMTVNGHPTTVAQILKTGDTLILATDERLTTPSFASNPAEIVFADQYLYVAAKPYGVAIHPDRAHKSETLGNMLATTFGNGFQLRIVTRLDKTTSGLVLGALDEITAQKLNTLQHGHGIVKSYVALVEGLVESDGEVTLPLTRMDGQNKTVVDISTGKQSHTVYRVHEKRENTTLLNVTPITGRTHQIRAHLSAIGHPIVGDTLYGAQKDTRIMLHCERLTFIHPYTGEQVDLKLPADF
ncbi:MAG: RluA family pseudouridine synthase [Clostridiales bacterium]|nr:RluA family pseudouridine synthase [Clostridiales bacterium]